MSKTTKATRNVAVNKAADTLRLTACDRPLASGFVGGRVALSRRGFVRVAAGAAALVGAAAVLSPDIAFATTIAEKQAEADEVRRRMDEWNVVLDQYSNDYYNALDAYDLAVAEMDAAQERLDAALARQAELNEQLNQRVRTMYKQGPLSFIDVIFGSRSFFEFTTSWDLLSSANERDVELIADYRAAQAEASAAFDQHAVASALAEQKLAEAEEIMQEAQVIYDAYQAELASLEAEIWEMVEAERRAEEERRRQEEEARQQAANGGGGGGGGGGGTGGGGNPGGWVDYQPGTFGSIVEAAYSRLGCPYVWGGTGPNEFDCSGLTSWCYRQVGKVIPRGGDNQYYSAPMRHSVADAQPGDILFKPGHVGIYIGGGQYIHAPYPGEVVKIANVSGYGWVGAARW